MGNKHPGVLLSKNLLADRWGKGKEESDTRLITIFIPHTAGT